jgi:hypothetical protein
MKKVKNVLKLMFFERNKNKERGISNGAYVNHSCDGQIIRLPHAQNLLTAIELLSTAYRIIIIIKKNQNK